MLFDFTLKLSPTYIGPKRVVFNVVLFKQEGDTKTVMDIAELNPVIYDSTEGATSTYSVFLAQNLQKGDNIVIGVYQYVTSETPRIMLPKGNTLVYWKLEQLKDYYYNSKYL